MQRESFDGFANATRALAASRRSADSKIPRERAENLRMERDAAPLPNPLPDDGGRRMAHAIDVLVQATRSDARDPAITPQSTGVLINTARALVRTTR